MSVFFCSDLHFGHKGIDKFRPFVTSSDDNQDQIIADWNACITKRDTVYVLGDAAFTTDACDIFRTLPGEKFLVRGNHDKLDTTYYLKYFKQVYGILKYKEFWLSHAPIHPNELRGRVNLHGHVHYSTILEEGLGGLSDKRYFNCCVENLREYGSSLMSLEMIRVLRKQPVPIDNTRNQDEITG